MTMADGRIQAIFDDDDDDVDDARGGKLCRDPPLGAVSVDK